MVVMYGWDMFPCAFDEKIEGMVFIESWVWYTWYPIKYLTWTP